MKPKTIAILAAIVGVPAAVGLGMAISGKTATPIPAGAPDQTTGGSATVANAAADPATATPDPPRSRPAVLLPAPNASPKVLRTPRPPEYTEQALMTKLRELSGTDAALSLRLAREGNVRFKDSPDAAERAWIVVKSLVNMGRNDEARTEGAAMIQKYQGTSWANDIHRHMFVNPPTDPSERGYGKKTELEENPK